MVFGISWKMSSDLNQKQNIQKNKDINITRRLRGSWSESSVGLLVSFPALLSSPCKNKVNAFGKASNATFFSNAIEISISDARFNRPPREASFHCVIQL